GVGNVVATDVGEAKNGLDRGHEGSHQPRRVTMPRSPSTRTRSPVLILLVAWPVPTTAGMPYSRATIAACDMVPPMSETAAAILPNTGPQLGAVTGHTRISPSRTWPISLTPSSTRAVPSPTPGEAAYPRTFAPVVPPVSRDQASMVSEVTPQSIFTAGSLSALGTGPSAG